MNGTRTALAIVLAAMLPMAGCLGLFSGDEAQDQADTSSLGDEVGNETAQDIESRAGDRFSNFTFPGQEDLEDQVLWFNGTIGPDPGTMVAMEDKNDRSGTNYSTQFVTNDISSQLPEGQPAEIKLKMWFLPGPGSSTQADLYVNVPGTHTDYSASDCDEFSWKVCVEERIVDTVGKSGEAAEVGVQIANNRAMESSLDYVLQVEISYVKDVVAPTVPYAVNVPENATGLIVNSEKPGADHIDGEFLVIGPDDELVEHVEYNDLALATESKLIPVNQAGEHIIYPIELTGGFLSVELDVPVKPAKLESRVLETTTERVEVAGQPAPGSGCVPVGGSDGCENETMTQGASTTFNAEGTFPLEVRGWIDGDGPTLNADAEVHISSSEGVVHFAKKWMKYEDERGQIGSTRDELNHRAYPDNLAKGEYTIDYVLSGSGSVGYTLTTYAR